MELIFIILAILAVVVVFIIYRMSQGNEGFSIVYPYTNPYYPYANSYSQCVEDIYGNTRCYAPSYYNRFYAPYRRRYPNRFRRVFRRYL